MSCFQSTPESSVPDAKASNNNDDEEEDEEDKNEIEMEGKSSEGLALAQRNEASEI